MPPGPAWRCWTPGTSGPARSPTADAGRSPPPGVYRKQVETLHAWLTGVLFPLRVSFSPGRFRLRTRARMCIPWLLLEAGPVRQAGPGLRVTRLLQRGRRHRALLALHRRAGALACAAARDRNVSVSHPAGYDPDGDSARVARGTRWPSDAPAHGS